MANHEFNNEAQLRHPWEKPVFIASVILNLALMVGAVVLASQSSELLKRHSFLAKNIKHIQTAVFALILAPPAIVIIRNVRRSFIRVNAVRLSRTQIPQFYGMLERHCAKLGMRRVPRLYLSEQVIKEPAGAFSIRERNYIVLSKDYMERKPETAAAVVSFMIGRELGRIRLGHTKWWYEMLLAYAIQTPYLKNVMTQVQTLSHDRYGAYLEPNGVRGLIVQAAGRRPLKLINIEEYLQQVQEYRGFWARLSDLTQQTPHISYRIKALCEAGLFQPESARDCAPEKESASKGDAVEAQRGAASEAGMKSSNVLDLARR